MSLFPMLRVFVILIIVVPTVFSICQSSSDLQRSYINGSFSFASDCFTVSSINCTSQWTNLSIPSCHPIGCGLHLKAYIAYYDANRNFPRFALNITVSESLNDKFEVMFEDVTEPQKAKCFTLLQNTNESKCKGAHQSQDLFFTPNQFMASDSYTTVKFLLNGKKMQYKFKNLYRKNVLLLNSTLHMLIFLEICI